MEERVGAQKCRSVKKKVFSRLFRSQVTRNSNKSERKSLRYFQKGSTGGFKEIRGSK